MSPLALATASRPLPPPTPSGRLVAAQPQADPSSTTAPSPEDASTLTTQQVLAKLRSVYAHHPRYARFAQHHPHANKALIVTAVVGVLTLPLWLRAALKGVFKLLLPKPKTWQQGGLWFTALLAGLTATHAAAHALFHARVDDRAWEKPDRWQPPRDAVSAVGVGAEDQGSLTEELT